MTLLVEGMNTEVFLSCLHPNHTDGNRGDQHSNPSHIHNPHALPHHLVWYITTAESLETCEGGRCLCSAEGCGVHGEGKGREGSPLLGFGVAVQHGAAGGLQISEPTIQVTAKASTQQSRAGGGEHTGEIKTWPSQRWVDVGPVEQVQDRKGSDHVLEAGPG